MIARALLSLASIVVGGAAVAACASAPPRELHEARTAYDHALHGPAAQLAPGDLRVARQQLQQAESSAVGDPSSQDTRDLAYAAIRASQIAEVHAREVQARIQREQAIDELSQIRAQQVRVTSAALSTARQELADAQQRAAEQAADLARLGNVKREPRGVVLTLSGSVLFASGKSELLPQAESKLREVADALAKGDEKGDIEIDGYTDSQGGEPLNIALSQRRAEAVRKFLVAHGVDADRVTARGFGPAKPVATNTTPEGRADNRRVEIVVKHANDSNPSGDAGDTNR
jgi:outer membrane protein OmpA-like peptidoglycan-associated protein